MPSPSPTLRPFWPAIALAAAVILTSPFMGLLRDRLFDSFGSGVVPVLAAVLGLAGLGAFAWVCLRIRAETSPLLRRRRWALLLVVLVLLVVQTFGFSTQNLQVDVVEKVHIFQYGGLALLFYSGLRRIGLGFGIELLALPVLLGALAGVLDESAQGFFQLRTADIRDVALNAVAAGCGLILALAIDLPDRTSRNPGSVRRVCRAGAVLILFVGLFYSTYHMGYEIRDPAVGSFVAWHDTEELARLSADRRERWTADPPTGLVAWHREDYYLTEAAWHANHRNERYGAGDAYMALHANRVLETYYDPFLDLESFRGSGRHRWSPDLIAQLEAELVKQGIDIPPEHYRSPVLRKRIRTRPAKSTFLGAVVLASMLLWGVGEALPRRARGSKGPSDGP